MEHLSSERGGGKERFDGCNDSSYNVDNDENEVKYNTTKMDNNKVNKVGNHTITSPSELTSKTFSLSNSLESDLDGGMGAKGNVGAHGYSVNGINRSNGQGRLLHDHGSVSEIAENSISLMEMDISSSSNAQSMNRHSRRHHQPHNQHQMNQGTSLTTKPTVVSSARLATKTTPPVIGRSNDSSLSSTNNHLSQGNLNSGPRGGRLMTKSTSAIDLTLQAEALRSNQLNTKYEKYSLWYWMTVKPLPFLIALPIVYLLLTGFGWVGPDDIEDSISAIWIPTSGQIYKDSQYFSKFKRDTQYDQTFFAAMARLRGDVTSSSGNLFTASRLEQIRTRMEELERTTIQYNGIIYTWEDICAITPMPYKLPCARLSAMDFFYEARWFFDFESANSSESTSKNVSTNVNRSNFLNRATTTGTTATIENDGSATILEGKQQNHKHFNASPRVTWYNELIRKDVIVPLISRYGILTTMCSQTDFGRNTGGTSTDVCNELVLYRTGDKNSSSYNPAALLTDINTLELSDECRICIETNYTEIITALFEMTCESMEVLLHEIDRYDASIGIFVKQSSPDLYNKMQQIRTALKTIIEEGTVVTLDTVREFYFYYVTRNIYATLGTDTYLANYGLLRELIDNCNSVGSLFGFTSCPPVTINSSVALAALYYHADHDYSSISTAGAPFPIWGSPSNGTPYLLMGNHPFGGSGINMSAPINSIAAYLDAANYDPNIFNTTNNPLTNSTTTLGNSTNSSSTRDDEKVWSPVYGTLYVNISSNAWRDMVETNPLYAWFMAALEPADHICGNGYLPGTNTGVLDVDKQTQDATKLATQFWCNEFSIPNANNSGTGNYSKQYFAKMWYDRLIDSPTFLNIQQGIDDPYSWTLGVGCGYKSGGERSHYTNQSEANILFNSSRELYFYDEGAVLGPVVPQVVLGHVNPPIGQYSFNNPLQSVGVIEMVYPALMPHLIMERVTLCNRPEGPVNNITFADAKEILYRFKVAFENAWTKDWNNGTEGETQFLGFFDDSGTVGTTGRMLRSVTLDNTILMVVSTLLIALFSVVFMFDFNLIESRVTIMFVGVTLVLLGYFAGLGFAVIIGTKINVTIAWTLPFLLMGLGVDDVYIVLMALKKQRGYTHEDFKQAMREVVVPVTMTSLINASMFAMLNISDIPAIYLTAQVALYCVILLYLVVILCFPAYCYLDMKRQASGRYDVAVCYKSTEMNSLLDESQPKSNDCLSKILYDYFYHPLVLSENNILRTITSFVILVSGVVVIGVAVWGITERQIGTGPEDFFPSNHQASVWARVRTEALGTWPVYIQWGKIDYSNPDIQMQMLKQFEDVAATSKIANINTRDVWIAEFILWATRLCDDNIGRKNFSTLVCGRDQIFKEENTRCSASWKVNKYDLKEAIFRDYDDPTCVRTDGGICRPLSRMHPEDVRDMLSANPKLDVFVANASFCPTIDNWSGQKWQYCLTQWRNITGSRNGGLMVSSNEAGTETKDCKGVLYNDKPVVWPIPISIGPMMFAYNLFKIQDTLDMINEVQPYCTDHPTIHCWVGGAPFDYYNQYEGIMRVLFELCTYSTLVAFIISFVFLYFKINFERLHERPKVFCGSLIGATMITLICIASLITTVGFSCLAGVKITGFSIMSFVLSIGFSVEYAVHIVARWLRADLLHKTSLDRVRHSMSFLMLPIFMSFISSTIGIVCLAFSYLEFIRIYFFRPLIIVTCATYFFGCWWLPVVLSYIELDVVKLGKAGIRSSKLPSRSLGHSNLDNNGVINHAIPSTSSLNIDPPHNGSVNGNTHKSDDHILDKSKYMYQEPFGSQTNL